MLWKKFSEFPKPEEKLADLSDLNPYVVEYLTGNSAVRMRYDHYLDPVASKAQMSAYFYRAAIRPIITAYDKWHRQHAKYAELWEIYDPKLEKFDKHFLECRHITSTEMRELKELEERMNRHFEKMEKYEQDLYASISKCTVDPRVKAS